MFTHKFIPFSVLLLFLFSSVSLWAAEGSKSQVRKPLPSQAEIAKLPSDGGKEFNRLIFEKSPYLLQHARNPVDWYPWGKEAFEQAKKLNKPVFLSVGYTTCHWCHVMEHESFEDEEVGKLMNERFVCVKVDREERPDIDAVYMTVTQQMTGSGGWPMTVIMTPEKQPYFAGTYFPKEGKFGRPGIKQILVGLSDAWKDDNEKVLEVAGEITKFLQEISAGTPGDPVKAELMDKAFGQLQSQYDSQYGGFGRERKFPVAHQLSFLTQYYKRTKKAEAMLMVENTLTQIRNGGIYDHIGQGVHRYSTDRQWLLPHFEKMLYDQAILAMAALDAWQVTGKESYADLVRELFVYVLRDMTSPEGGFYSAEDADSEGVEGKFYVWTPEEIEKILGEKNAKVFSEVYNIREGGNFRDEATGKATGESIAHLQMPLSLHSAKLKIAEDTLRKQLAADRNKLFQHRKTRIHPQKDDKVLTDWNGLMIAAMSKAGTLLQEPKYIQAATKAADFVLEKLRSEDGRLLKRYRTGSAGLPAHLEDYAFFTWGLLNLYEATFEIRYLQAAIELNELAIQHFWDSKTGGFYMTADDGEKLLVRHKELYDGAIPSGNSVAALNLLRISRITGNTELEDRAAKLMQAFSGDVEKSPYNYTQLMLALDFATGPSLEIVISGDLKDPRTQELIQAIHQEYIPNKVLVHRPSKDASKIVKIAPYTENQRPASDGSPRVFVCQNFECKQPVKEVEKLMAILTSDWK